MDHLPVGENPVYRPPEVPYLCHHGFLDLLVQKGFYAYPEIRGFNHLHLDYSIYAYDALNSFIQEWLYFGFLHEVLASFDIKLNIRSLIRRNNRGVAVVTSKRLPRLLHRWGSAFEKVYLGGHRDQCQKAWDLCGTAISVLQRLGDSTLLASHAVDANGMSSEQALHLSIAIVLEIVQHELYRANVSILPRDGGLHMPYLEARLRANNRCLFHLRGFLKRPKELYLLSLLPTAVDTSHSECSAIECKGHQVLEGTYETRHVAGCAGCNFIGPEMEDLLEFYRPSPDGVQQSIRTPVVQIVIVDGALKIRLEDAGRRYTAISHVWSDGLGNECMNELPECQVRRLAELCSNVQHRHLLDVQMSDMPLVAKLVYYVLKVFIRLLECLKLVLLLILLLIFGIESRVRSNILDEIMAILTRIFSTPSNQFWIDTLCIPIARTEHVPENKCDESSISSETYSVDYERRRNARKLAISQIEEVFSSANRVLVLDADLQKVGRCRQERLYGIATSRWMTRLWTFREGTSGIMRLFFQLDGALLSAWDFMYLLDVRYIEAGLNHCGLIHEVCLWLRSTLIFGFLFSVRTNHANPFMSRFFQSPLRTGLWLSNALQVLATKSTTKAADEAVCISSICGMSWLIQPILNLEDSRARMSLLIQNLDPQFHVSIMFTPGRRLTTPGLGWCPESFLSYSSLSDVPPVQNLLIVQHMLSPLALRLLERLATSVSRQNIVSSTGGESTDVSLAELREDGLLCELPAWNWSSAVVNDQPYNRIIVAGSNEQLPTLDIYSLQVRNSRNEMTTLNQEQLTGELAILWGAQLEGLNFKSKSPIKGVLVRYIRASTNSKDFNSVKYVCLVEICFVSLNFQQQQDIAEGVRKGKEVVVSVLGNESVWLIN